MERPAAESTPLVYQLREGEGLQVRDAQLLVESIGDGDVQLAIGGDGVAFLETFRTGETVVLGGVTLAILSLSDDGKRRLVLRAEAAREVVLEKLGRGEMPARATSD